MSQDETYQLYQKGRKLESKAQFEEAINTYIEYSDSLSEKDQFVPYYWIAKLYSKIGKDEESMKARIKYALGCTPAGTAKLLTEIGNEYEKLNRYKEAIECYQIATDRHDKTDMTSKIEKLKELL